MKYCWARGLVLFMKYDGLSGGVESRKGSEQNVAASLAKERSNRLGHSVRT
jgi:hypothetical protein